LKEEQKEKREGKPELQGRRGRSRLTVALFEGRSTKRKKVPGREGGYIGEKAEAVKRKKEKGHGSTGALSPRTQGERAAFVERGGGKLLQVRDLRPNGN